MYSFTKLSFDSLFKKFSKKIECYFKFLLSFKSPHCSSAEQMIHDKLHYFQSLYHVSMATFPTHCMSL